MEPAFFFRRVEGKLAGLLVSHVDDIEAGIKPGQDNDSSDNTKKLLNFAKCHEQGFIFRGREIQQHDDGSITVQTQSYTDNLKAVKIPRDRPRAPEADLTEEEKSQTLAASGELGWLARQLRMDLAYQSGCPQRAAKAPCIGDLVQVNSAISEAKRGATFLQKLSTELDGENTAIVILSDSSHANDGPVSDDIEKYQSVGGRSLMIVHQSRRHES